MLAQLRKWGADTKPPAGATAAASPPRAVADAEGDMRVVLIGLDGSGKTTALYRFERDAASRNALSANAGPTIGFSVELLRVTLDDGTRVRIDCWDSGGSSRLRALWAQYYAAAHALCYFVDSADRKQMAAPDNAGVTNARADLCEVLELAECAGKPLLVVCTKQDLPAALLPSAVADALELPAEAVDDTALAAASVTPPKRCDAEAAVTAALSTALPVQPLLALMLEYCTFPSEFIRVIGTSDATTAVDLRRGLNWLVSAVYRRSGLSGAPTKRWPCVQSCTIA